MKKKYPYSPHVNIGTIGHRVVSDDGITVEVGRLIEKAYGSDFFLEAFTNLLRDHTTPRNLLPKRIVAADPEKQAARKRQREARRIQRKHHK